MQKEREREDHDSEEDFKNLVFANNPKLYELLYSPTSMVPVGQPEPQPDAIRIPETIGDVANLLADLKAMGGPDLSKTELG
jgi:hypothetical protein